MSSGSDPIIVCGTAAQDGPAPDKTIVVFDGPISIAEKCDRPAVAAYLESKGVSHMVALMKANVAGQLLELHYKLYSEELERLGIPYTRHTPHVQP